MKNKKDVLMVKSSGSQGWLKDGVVLHTGARTGEDEAYADKIRELGTALAQNGFDNVTYGGGRSGLMYEFSRSAWEGGARVHAVSLAFFAAAQNHDDMPKGMISSLKVSPDIRQRMVDMRALGNGSVVGFGAFGTLQETFEWLNSRSAHIKPITKLNYNGYWDGLKDFMECAIDAGHAPVDLEKRIYFKDDVDGVIAHLNSLNASSPVVESDGKPKVIDLSQYILEGKNSVLVKPGPFPVMEAVIDRLISYDLSNVKGQNLFEEGDTIKPIIFVDEDQNGYFNGLKKQLQTIQELGIMSPDRKQFFRFAQSMDIAEKMIERLDIRKPLRPNDLLSKHAESSVSPAVK